MRRSPYPAPDKKLNAYAAAHASVLAPNKKSDICLPQLIIDETIDTCRCAPPATKNSKYASLLLPLNRNRNIPYLRIFLIIFHPDIIDRKIVKILDVRV